MIKIAICDDDVILANQLEKTVLEQCENKSIAHVCDVFCNPEKLKQVLENKKSYDLIFLDIEMDGMNGVELGKYLRKNCNDITAEIVYISSKEKYAMELFQNRPLNFLIKPIDKTDVKKAIEYVQKLRQANTDVLKFQNDGVLYQVAFKDILYLCSSGHKVVVYTKDETISAKAKLSDFIKKINSDDFVLIHKSYFINYNYVAVAQYEKVVLENGTTLSISQARRKLFREFIFKKIRNAEV